MPFLVGGAICLVNSDNERDSSLLNRRISTSQRPAGPGVRPVVARGFTVGVQTILLRGTGGF
jgi:hypothetical protein